MTYRSVFSAVLLAAFSVTLFAQDASTGYHLVSCFKVKPGKAGEFRKWAAEDGRKLQQAYADSGRISTAFLLRAVIPEGVSAQCDYLVVQLYPGAPPAPIGMEEASTAFKKAGLAISPKDYLERANSLVELVSNSMNQQELLVGVAKKGDYFMVNYMKAPNVAEWVAFEKKVWQPMAESMVSDGVQRGWSVNVQVLPAGSDLKFQGVTVDIYPSWDAVFKSIGFAERFKKVHPDMEIGTTMENAEKVRTILSTQLFQVEDMVVPAK
jgi:hypothetical protein